MNQRLMIPLKKTSLILNPLTNNPAYDVTNTILFNKLDVLGGLFNNKVILSDQNILLPNQDVITRQN